MLGSQGSSCGRAKGKAPDTSHTNLCRFSLLKSTLIESKAIHVHAATPTTASQPQRIQSPGYARCQRSHNKMTSVFLSRAHCRMYRILTSWGPLHLKSVPALGISVLTVQHCLRILCRSHSNSRGMNHHVVQDSKGITEMAKCQENMMDLPMLLQFAK